MSADSEPVLAPRREAVYDMWSNASARPGAFDPALSPLHERIGFIVGAPRSGTTWLQQLLVVHPLVTTGGESHLFCEGLPDIFKNFANPDETSHLSSWVNEPELLTMVRSFADAVFQAQRVGTRPDAHIVIEKTPNHRLQSALQARLYPDAKYIHIVRDGRDATASQRALWGAWRSEFANPDRVAAQWAESVRDVRRHFGDLAYLELRYEDVVADTPGALARIFDHLGVTADASLCAAAAEFGKAPVNTARTSGDLQLRKRRSNALAIRSVARAAGDLLVEFEYATQSEVDHDAALRTPDTVAFDVREAARQALRSLRRRLKRSRPEDRPRPVADESNPVFAAGKVVGRGLQDADHATVCAQLAATARLGTTTGASAVADQLLEKFHGWRATNIRVADQTALVTLVRDGQDRTVLRLETDNGEVVAVDEL